MFLNFRIVKIRMKDQKNRTLAKWLEPKNILKVGEHEIEQRE